MAGFNHNNSTLRVCIDCVKGRTISGRVLSRRLTEPYHFPDLNSLVLQMEAVFDAQNFPQAYQRLRTFLRVDGKEALAAADPDSGMTEEEVNAGRGQVATVELRVVSRRNSTWQGTVNWLDSSVIQEFSSYLELMHIADEKLFGKME